MEVKSATITEKGQVSIPKDLRTSGTFKIGSKVAILVFKDRIELRPMSSISEAMSTALASERSLAKEWLTPEEDEAWKGL